MSGSPPDAAAVDAHIPLRPVEFQILVSLGSGPRHGYRILQDADARRAGSVPGLATLYRALRRLSDSGLTLEVPAPPDADADDARRRYFQLTALGRAVARAEALRLRSLLGEAAEARLLDAEGGAA